MGKKSDRASGQIAVAWRWLQLDGMAHWMPWAWIDRRADGHLMMTLLAAESIRHSEPDAARKSFVSAVRRILVEEVARLEEEARARAAIAPTRGANRDLGGVPRPRGLLVVQIGHGHHVNEIVVDFIIGDRGPELTLGREGCGPGDLHTQAHRCWSRLSAEIGARLDKILSGWQEVARAFVGDQVTLALWRSPQGEGLIERNPKFLPRMHTGSEEWAELEHWLRELQQLAPEKFETKVVSTGGDVGGEHDSMPIAEAIRAFESLVRTLRARHRNLELLVRGRRTDHEEAVTELWVASGLPLPEGEGGRDDAIG